ncbi:MAG: 30S ribosomal protein S18 [Candidatus Babeliales bacterium]
MKNKVSKLKVSGRLLRKKARRLSFSPKKQCRFCGAKGEQLDILLDYKNVPVLKAFLTERGKILPSRISGVCCRHQRELSNSIKKSRTMALLPYCASGF